MKKIHFLILLSLAGFCSLSWTKKPTKKKTAERFKVTGVMLQTTSYCGGARPTEEMLEEFKTPKGIPFGKLLIKKASLNKEGDRVIDSIQTDEKGNFLINLPVGNYCVVEEWKTKRLTFPVNDKNQTVDSACYKNLYKTCDYQLNIAGKNITDIQLVFHQPCFYNQPCIIYKGPLPH